jgi:integrase
MAKLNAKNERIKRDYCRWQKEAQGKSDVTVDAMRKVLSRFEGHTGVKDFGTFNREQAIAFKARLTATENVRSGERISLSTVTSTLNALKDFFRWLAWQPGFKSKIHAPDIEYLTPSIKDATAAKADKLRDFPSIEQIRAVVEAMPTETAIDRRNRALIAFAILTGMRDRAMASLSLRHVDMSKTPPLVRQEPDSVATKFSKAINTYFFPVGDDFAGIVSGWIVELRTDHLFAPNDPLFPKTRIGQGNDPSFRVVGIEPTHWSDASPIRAVFRAAFERIGLPYFPPHSFRHTLVHHMENVCRTPEQIKAWSQNLGHEHVATTLTSYGRIDPHRQGEVIRGISKDLGPVDIKNKLATLIASL